MTSEPRTGRALIDATRPFAEERRGTSWAAVLSTFALLAAAYALAAAPVAWPLRLSGTLLAGLLTVRAFILYHDHLHGALLRDSRAAGALMTVLGWFVLTPPTVWRQTHNYHHAHTAKIVGSHIGSYAMVTTDMWRQMDGRARLLYRVARHPLTIVFAHFTVFAYGMCLHAFLRNPRKNWDSLAALAVHVALGAAILWVAGPMTFFLAFFGPLALAFMLGAYLFYAQHNYEGVHVQPREEWRFDRAALESSSYMRLGPVMSYFTGNIGYHHVHHLNPCIPFYRLPEAMAAIPELQHPGVTGLSLRDIAACFRLKLWDPARGRMVGYEAAAAPPGLPAAPVAR